MALQHTGEAEDENKETCTSGIIPKNAPTITRTLKVPAIILK